MVVAYLLRCFTKANGTFSSSALPLVPIVAPYQQDMEMKPLSHIMVAMCLASSIPEHGGQVEEDGVEAAEQPPSPQPCCRGGAGPLCLEYADGEAGGAAPGAGTLQKWHLIKQRLVIKPAKELAVGKRALFHPLQKSGAGAACSSPPMPLLGLTLQARCGWLLLAGGACTHSRHRGSQCRPRG